MDGYPVPPHFQVRSLAQTEENKKLDQLLFTHMRNVRGKFGFDQVREHGVTANCNAKAGMDDEEFRKYVMDCIVPLYPDAADKPGKRVLLIVDSGPGRTQLKMLADLRAIGIYVKAGVPNTTHITQPTDQNYGMFKSIYRSNLKLLTKHTESIKHTSIPLLVFGGDYTNDEGVVLCRLEGAFDEAFSFDRNQQVWRKLGFYPFTRACLLDAKVKHEVVVRADGTIDLEADPLAHVLMKYENENKEAVAKINQLGAAGNYLLKQAPKLTAQRKKIAVTVPNTRERQDALGRASTAGGQFFANAGAVINSNDFFIAAERKQRSEEIIVLEKHKKEYDNYVVLAAKVKQLIALKKDKGIDVYTHSLNDRKDITGEQLKLLIEDHTGKKPGAKDSTKDRLLALWLDARDKKAHEPKEWTTVHDGRLHELRDEEITIDKTELGRAAMRQLQGIASMAQLLPQAVVDNLLPEEHKKALLSKLCPTEVKGPVEEV